MAKLLKEQRGERHEQSFPIFRSYSQWLNQLWVLSLASGPCCRSDSVGPAWIRVRWVTQRALPSSYQIPGKHIKPAILWKRILRRATTGEPDWWQDQQEENEKNRLKEYAPFVKLTVLGQSLNLSSGHLRILLRSGGLRSQVARGLDFARKSAINHPTRGLTRRFVHHFY